MKGPAVAVVLLGVLGACGSGSSSTGGGSFSCSGKSGPCANDPQLTSAESMDCAQAQSGNCGSQYTAYKQCQFANPSCDSSGVSTPDNACSMQAQAYAQCLIGAPPTDAGGGGG